MSVMPPVRWCKRVGSHEIIVVVVDVVVAVESNCFFINNYCCCNPTRWSSKVSNSPARMLDFLSNFIFRIEFQIINPSR